MVGRKTDPEKFHERNVVRSPDYKDRLAICSLQNKEQLCCN